MSNQIKYICSHCGAEHNEWPAISNKAPDNYANLSQEEKETIAEISSDFCVITYPDQVDRFIRCTLTQKVTDHCEDLDYGLWVSLSEKSFNDYSDNFDNESHEATYFGWLSNHIEGYEFNDSIPMTVYTRTGNHRPNIMPHKDFDHPFVIDYYNGITKQEAERRINVALGRYEQTPIIHEVKKPWWKIW
jgi:hypothetical protein